MATHEYGRFRPDDTPTDQLEPGDAVWWQWGPGGSVTRSTVDRVTKTMLIANQGARFNRQTGVYVGDLYGPRVHPLSRERNAKIEAGVRLARDVQTIREAFSSSTPRIRELLTDSDIAEFAAKIKNARALTDSDIAEFAAKMARQEYSFVRRVEDRREDDVAPDAELLALGEDLDAIASDEAMTPRTLWRLAYRWARTPDPPERAIWGRPRLARLAFDGLDAKIWTRCPIWRFRCSQRNIWRSWQSG